MIKTRHLVLILIVFGASIVLGDDLPARYHTYQKVLDTLTDLRDSYPQILYLDTLGFSTQDNIPMLRLKISDNPQIDEDEPAVFFDGGVHADEVLSVEVVVNFVQDIIKKYDSADPNAVNYIQQMEIFVIPFINPEGHLVIEGGDLDWRKNKSDNDSNSVFDYHDGVDNNRNYDYGWDIDNESDALAPEGLQFKGRAPFTETENIVMAEFGWQYRPIIAIDFHSPTYGRPNVAYYPWYWYSSDGGHGYGPDESLMQSICQSYTSQILAIPDDSNTVTYTARRALVNKGDFKTYFYGNFGTAAFSVEISDTTIQNPALIDSIVDAHLPSLYYLLGRALGSGITGVIRDSVTLEPLEAEVQVLQHINDDVNPRLSRPDFGRYHRVLASGTYTLRFIKDGYETKTIYNVSVGSSSPTTTNVLLIPLNPVPPAPVLAAPLDDSILDDEYVDFSWNPATTATGYVIEIAGDILFQTIVEYDSTISGLAYQNISPFSAGSYYWRVKTRIPPFWGDYCAPWEFYVDVDTSSITYGPGDVNNDHSVIGSDVTYLVNYFRGNTPPPIEIDGFFPAADANGDCRNIGSDVTYLVNFFRGGSAPVDGHCF